MSIGGFILGLILMVAGFFMVWRTNIFLTSFGDISELFGATGASWLSWKIVGMILMVIGFLVAFGLLSLFFQLTIGRLFQFGGI